MKKSQLAAITVDGWEVSKCDVEMYGFIIVYLSLVGLFKHFKIEIILIN